MEVAEGTRALASELDEAYDRSDELGKEVENEMMMMMIRWELERSMWEVQQCSYHYYS